MPTDPNFLRDVGEDLDRGRVYLPQEDLARFGTDPWQRRVTPQWRALMRFEIDRTRRETRRFLAIVATPEVLGSCDGSWATRSCAADGEA